VHRRVVAQLSALTCEELLAISGGMECRGLWIGTNDGMYGLCLGHTLEN